MPAVIDKDGRLPNLAGLTLELGCGTKATGPGSIGVDILDTDSARLVGDVFAVLAAIDDGSVGAIHSSHFFEHVDDVPRLLDECARVLAPRGTMQVVVPHWSNPYFYSDPTHRAHYGLYTFCYLTHANGVFRRGVPDYGNAAPFQLLDVQLRFFSDTFRWRNAIKSRFTTLFNSHRYLKEFYEENLAQMIPCYELEYSLRRVV